MLPPIFLLPALVFFTSALIEIPFVLEELKVHFYQPRVLMVTHMLTLGWLTMAVQGVLYRFVPALTKQSLPLPRVAYWQCGTYLLGSWGLIIHFWIGNWIGTEWAAGVVAFSVLLLSVNLVPMLWRAPRHGLAEFGLMIALGFLVLAASLGTLLAVSKTHYSFVAGLLPGHSMRSLAAHAHLAALGWLGVTISALAMRFLPAFLMPTIDPTKAAAAQVGILSIGVVLLATSLLAPGSSVLGQGEKFGLLLVTSGVVGHGLLILAVHVCRQLPRDPTTDHALLSGTWALIAACAGLGLWKVGTDSELTGTLAATYGASALLGWMSNILIGISYKLFPAFVAAGRAQRGKITVPLLALAVPPPAQRAILILFNLGLAGLIGGFLLDVGLLSRGGSVALATAGVAYSALTARIFSFLLREPARSSEGGDTMASSNTTA